MATAGSVSVDTRDPYTYGAFCWEDRIYFTGVRYTMDCHGFTGHRNAMATVTCTAQSGVRCDMTRADTAGRRYGSDRVIFTYSWSRQTFPAVSVGSISGPATVATPQSYSYTVTSAGGETAVPRTYEWQVSRDNGATWGVAGTTTGGATGTIALGIWKPQGVILLRARVSTADKQSATTAAVSVDTRAVPPLSVGPISGPTYVDSVGPRSWTVTSANGRSDVNRTYDWQISRDGGVTWTSAASQSNGTSDTYTRSITRPDGILQIRAVVTTADTQTVASQPISVDTRQVPALTISSISGPTSVRVGFPYTWSVSSSYTGVKDSRMYRWYKSVDGGTTWNEVQTDLNGGLTSEYKSVVGKSDFLLKVVVWTYNDDQTAVSPVLSVIRAW